MPEIVPGGSYCGGMSTTLRHLEILLLCEICEGEIDVESGTVTAHCRHCGIAFAVDAPAIDQLSA